MNLITSSLHQFLRGSTKAKTKYFKCLPLKSFRWASVKPCCWWSGGEWEGVVKERVACSSRQWLSIFKISASGLGPSVSLIVELVSGPQGSTMWLEGTPADFAFVFSTDRVRAHKRPPALIQHKNLMWKWGGLVSTFLPSHGTSKIIKYHATATSWGCLERNCPSRPGLHPSGQNSRR